MGDVHFFCRIVPAYSPLPFRDTRGVLDAHTPEESEIMKRFRQNRHREPNSDHFGAWTTANGPHLAEIRSPEGATPRWREGELASRVDRSRVLVMNFKLVLFMNLSQGK